MRLKDIQRDVCIRPGNSTKETLNSALLQKKGYVTASTSQKQKSLSGASISNSNSGQNYSNSFKIKQKPTLLAQQKNQNRTKPLKLTNIRILRISW